MSRFFKFVSAATKLPSRTRLTLTIVFMAGLSHFIGNRASKSVQSTNYKHNSDILSRNPPNFKCYHVAKQYYEECDEVNRENSYGYIEKICTDLEGQLRSCRDKLYREISSYKPYSMDPPVKVTHCPTWLKV